MLPPREDVTGHPVNQVVRNVPCDREILRKHDACGCATAKSHATPFALREGLRERTFARLVSFSKPRGTFCGLKKKPSRAVCVCISGPVADTGGDSSSREPSRSHRYRCHGSDSILISVNAVSCILERRSNGQCIIDRCKTGVAHLTDEVCACLSNLYQKMPCPRAAPPPPRGGSVTRYTINSFPTEAEGKSAGLGLDPGAPEVAQTLCSAETGP